MSAVAHAHEGGLQAGRAASASARRHGQACLPGAFKQLVVGRASVHAQGQLGPANAAAVAARAALARPAPSSTPPLAQPPAAARRWTGRRSAQTRGAWSQGSPPGPFAPPPAAGWTRSGCPAAWGCSTPAANGGSGGAPGVLSTGARDKPGAPPRSGTALCGRSGQAPLRLRAARAQPWWRCAPTLITPGARFAASIALRHPRSTAAKRLASMGSCCWMSRLANTGSRYIHARCSATHCSSTSDTWQVAVVGQGPSGRGGA